MARQLFPECDVVVIKTVQISRKLVDEQDQPELWNSYAVLIGEALAADGTRLQSINQKIPIGTNSGFPWTSDTIEKDIEEVATIVKDAVKAIEDTHTKLGE